MDGDIFHISGVYPTILAKVTVLDVMKKVSKSSANMVSTTTIKIPFFTGKVQTKRTIDLIREDDIVTIHVNECHEITKYLI